MAKKALLDVLEQTIGKYVLNLDAESLNVAVWSGKIQLNALELDCPAVNAELDRQAAEAPNLALPFRVVGGQFKNFQVDVPWSHLMSQSVVLRAQGLHVTVEPYDRTANADFLYAVAESESVRAQKVEDARAKSVQNADIYRQRANTLHKLAQQDLEATESSKQSSDAQSSFGARLVRRIIENIQLEISDVQIHLQGDDSSAGVVLESLKLVTTDKDGRRTFVDRTAQKEKEKKSFLYKTLQISGLGVYLDESEKAHSHRLSAIKEDAAEGLDHSYVLAPLSFQAQLRQADSNICIEYPKYLLRSELHSLSILLSKSQVELGRKIAQQMKPSERSARPLFPEYRPLSRVTSKSAKEWWKYAVRCIGRLNGRRSWVEFFLAFQRRKLYIPLYKRRAHAKECTWLTPLSPAELDELMEVERDRSISVEGLMTWRNIADAQFEREQEKHNAKIKKGSLFTSLFGSKENTEEEPPVHLSVDEMKELEAVTLEQVADAELSDDSRLADVKFVLGSFKIHLTSYDLRPLAALEMGTVSTALDMNADGSFDFDFSLSSLQIHDKVTPGSLFPSVLRNQARPDVPEAMNKAFMVRLAKGKRGDQHLDVKLNTFEAVASPMLITEMKRFISLTDSAPKPPIDNPLLTQSLSGSVDLFYDAAQGSQHNLRLSDAEEAADILSPRHRDAVADLSVALVDAWKTKTKTKTSWVVEIDLQAPIVVIPESCTNPRAHVLVFDLGHLRLQYGTIEASPKVSRWFKDNPRKETDIGDPVLDSGLLKISSMTFMVGKANYWRRLVKKHESGATTLEDDAVVEPISLSMDFGIESRAKEDVPRICTFGVLPSITLGLSPSQLSDILRVSNAWARVFKDLSPEMPNLPSIEDDASELSTPSRRAGFIDRARRGSEVFFSAVQHLDREPFPTFHADMRLQKLSIRILSADRANGIEAHLVSVAASACTLSDGNTVGRLSMGWFWILDRFENDFPRRQRLIAHSNLPKSANDFAQDGRYDVMGELGRLGVFDDDFAGSTDLADITYKHSGGPAFGMADPFQAAELVGDEYCVDTVLDAKFTSLYVNWNPRGVKTMIAMLSKFFDFMQEGAKSEVGSLIVSGQAQLRMKGSLSQASREDKDDARMGSVEGTTIVRAQMENLQISLNSAKDDLPVFVLNMSESKTSLIIGSDDNMKVSLVLGDLRIVSPEMGRTNSMYRTVLGLAPGKAESLLSVQYCQGSEAIGTLRLDGIDKSEFEACGDVVVSPMRMVHIQSQVLALVEYATEGILGAITAQAASTAAAAAAEIAATTEAKKFFRVTATGFEVLLPQAAYHSNYMSIQTGVLEVSYTGLPAPGGGNASLSLSDVLLRDSADLELQEEPIRMDVKVDMPPDGVGTKEDQALKVAIEISKASFLIAKPQYRQLLMTLDKNISDPDLYLRDVSVVDEVQQDGNKDEPTSTAEIALIAGLTHAGVEAVDNQRRTYLDVRISVFSLELSGEDHDDPLIRLAAIDAAIALRIMSDEGKIVSEVTLRDLVCDDRRLKTCGRQYRSLIYQDRKKPGAGGDCEAQDVFSVSYESGTDNSSSIDMSIGSPRLVFIPDAVSDVLSFLSVDREQSVSKQSEPDRVDQESSEERQVVEVSSASGGDGIEASIHTEQTDAHSLASITFSMKTGRCSVILVDLGSNALLPSAGSRMTASIASAAEIIVLEGMFDAKLSLETNMKTNQTTNLDAQVDGDSMEAYTAFGKDFHSPLQILDPTKFSLYMAVKTVDETSRTVDVRMAAITPLDICCSMRNVALINAILAGIYDSFEEEGGGEEEEDGDHRVLSQEEAARIQRLAAVLEAEDADTSTHGSETSGNPESSRSVVSKDMASSTSESVSVKITMPETKVTLVNDLQGLDEALLRVTIRNLVAGGQMRTGERMAGGRSDFTGFDFSIHTALLSDYFDTSTSLWKPLLLRPWEMTCRGSRGPSERFQSHRRPSTTLDIESFPCYVSFSEQFLMSLASANRMWSVYSVATKTGFESMDPKNQPTRLRRSMAASAARTFISSLPYAVENHSGIDVGFLIKAEREGERRTCRSGSIEYFRFEPPKGAGRAGKRLYGQDVDFEKTVSLFVGDSSVDLTKLDGEIGGPRRAHELANGQVLVTYIVKEGKTTVLHVTSGVDIYNQTSIPFSVAVEKDAIAHAIGSCSGTGHSSADSWSAGKSTLGIKNGRVSKTSRNFGIPVDMVDSFRTEWKNAGSSSISLLVSPQLASLSGDDELRGGIHLEPARGMFTESEGYSVSTCFDITCRPWSLLDPEGSMASRRVDPFVLQVHVSMVLIDDLHPSIEIILQPRATLENRMPVAISVRSPMPHTFSATGEDKCSQKETIHDLQPGLNMEIFTPGPSIAISVKCSESPVGGASTGWMDGGWLDLPMVSEFRLPEPLRCSFPFVRNTVDPLSLAVSHGTEFFVAEGSRALSELSDEKSIDRSQKPSHRSLESPGIELSATSSSADDWRNFYVTVCHYAVDHIGDLLFEQLTASPQASLRRSATDLERTRRSSSQVSTPFGAFRSNRHRGRITLLPGSRVPIRLLHLTMEGDEGHRRSAPFCIEDVSICDGGVDATPLCWEDGRFAGFFAYRKLLNSYQSEIHVVPEYVVYNGSEEYKVRVRQPGGTDATIDPGMVVPLRTQSGETAIISLEYPEIGARASPVRVDSLKLRFAVVKLSDGSPIGRVAVQTVVGAHDSRLVVKLGVIKYGSDAVPGMSPSKADGLLKNDFLRFRILWSELRLTLNEARPVVSKDHAFFESALDTLNQAGSPASPRLSQTTPRSFFRGSSPSSERTWVEARERYTETLTTGTKETQDPVCTILFYRFTVDWQRVFKDEESSSSQPMTTGDALTSPERSRLAVIIQNIQIRDETPESPYPIVFDSTSNARFFDLSIKFRGPIDLDVVKVDLIDLKLAHVDGVSQKIVVNTSEDFVWKLLDLADRILVAASEFAGVDIELQWDDEHDGYVVSVKEKQASYIDEGTAYTPPKGEKLYNITKTKVSPFTLIVSFKRTPQASRYQVLRGVRGASIMNYFTRRLKFAIDKAELKFARFECDNFRGPPDRLLELLSTVYLSRMKLKFVTILTAASFQDWKYLASRDGGDDEFVEGDILRATGNLAGTTAHYVLRKAGKGLGSGVRNVTSKLGDGIESATGAIGARAVGAGVNTLVTGVGEGAGQTLTGVGTGAGNVLKGTGQGIGHVFGGVTGGAMMIGKGLGKGITEGDGKAVVSGVTQGLGSVGAGVGQGVESVVTGTAEGVLSVGQGLLSGVKSVGKGIGGAFAECCSCSPCFKGGDERQREGALVPLLPQGNAAQPP